MRHKTIHQALSFLFLFGWMTIPAQSVSLQEAGACAFGASAPLNDAVWVSGIASRESDLFVLEIPTPGTLGVEVAVQGGERGEPVLFFLGRICPTVDQLSSSPEEDEAFTYIDKSVRGYLVDVRIPGTYFVRVAAADPLQAMGNYQLSSRLVEQRPQWSEALTDDDFLSEKLLVVAKSDDEEIDIDEWDEDILSLTSPPADPTEAWLGAFCRQGRETDGGDFPWCAKHVALGSLVQAELASPLDDDSEYFTFTLDRTRVLSIETFGPVNTFGTVYDDLGHRVAFSGDGGESDNFRIVKVLSPGRYALRVEGVFGSEGAYLLAIRPERGLIE